VRGETPHFEYVAGQSAAGIARVGLEAGLPVVYGVVTADMAGTGQALPVVCRFMIASEPGDGPTRKATSEEASSTVDHPDIRGSAPHDCEPSGAASL